MACLLGCGLDESGIVPGGDGGTILDARLDSNPVDSPPPVDGPPIVDAPGDVPSDVPADVQPPVDAGVCATDANTCVAPDVPAGWSPVAYIENSTNACPADWNTSDDYVTNVGNGNATCSCSCSIAAPPSCTTGTTNTKYSNNSGCGSNGVSLTFTNGACQALGGNLANYFAGSPIPQTGGTCNVTATASGTLTSTPVRLCVPVPGCDSAACGGYAPAGYKACVVANGDVACPSGSMFKNKHAVAKSASPGCTNTCGSGCTFQGSGCSTPQLHTFSDNNCNTSVVTLPSDNTCVATNNNNAYVGSVSYTATSTVTGCTATGSTSLQVSYTTQRTVCCTN